MLPAPAPALDARERWDTARIRPSIRSPTAGCGSEAVMVHSCNNDRPCEKLDAWRAACANLRTAEARFAPVQSALSHAERAYFARRSAVGRGTGQDPEVEAVKARLDQAYEDDRVFGSALEEAAKRLTAVRVPDLAALIEKVEILRRIGCDDSVTESILSDLRHLQARDRASRSA